MNPIDEEHIKEILDKHDQAFAAFRRAEEQLDFALETNRSITKALRESRKARNEMIKLMQEANRAALRIVNRE